MLASGDHPHVVLGSFLYPKLFFSLINYHPYARRAELLTQAREDSSVPPRASSMNGRIALPVRQSEQLSRSLSFRGILASCLRVGVTLCAFFLLSYGLLLSATDSA